MTSVMNTYGRLPVAFSHGKGAWLYDSNEEAYLDALGGIAVCGLGHCHPHVTDAITRQANTLLHTSNLYSIPLQEQLATALCDASGMEKIFFSNSGAEANEAAIKIARKYGNQNGVDNPSILVFDDAFHGRTMATLTATGSRKVQQGFEPLLRGFVRAPYNDLEAVKHILANNKNIVAIMVEPIQGEAGIIVPEADFIRGLGDLCQAHELLLLLDEIQTGVGRTGSFYAFQQLGVTPDVVTSAKALGNGVPIGACLTRGVAATILQQGNHGSTYGGNPLACAAALAVVETVNQATMLKRISELGERIKAGLQGTLGDSGRISKLRGKGLMIAFDVDPKFSALMQRGLDHRVVLNVTGNNSIRLLPPYILSDAEADQLVERVSATVLNAKETV